MYFYIAIRKESLPLRWHLAGRPLDVRSAHAAWLQVLADVLISDVFRQARRAQHRSLASCSSSSKYSRPCSMRRPCYSLQTSMMTETVHDNHTFNHSDENARLKVVGIAEENIE